MDDSLRLDPLDRQIIASLERDARSSYATIGAVVGLSASAVKRRVDRLLHAGVVTAFRAVLDPAAMGWGVEAFIELFCVGRTTAAEIQQLVRRHPEVVAAYTVTGEANAMLQLRAADTGALEVALERLRGERAVIQTNSRVVLSRLDVDAVA